MEETQITPYGPSDAEVVVVGGGISGICMAIKLIESGIKKLVIIEKSGGFGGTWRDNRYPGCRCDIPAHLYSFSFAGNPDWSRVFPDQTEILAYLTKVAAQYQLHRFARFSSAVEQAVWDKEESKWKISVRVLGGKDADFESSYTITTDFLISAVGQLNEPHTPEISGLDSFKGKLMHSARWNLSDDLKGKRIGIIGNGATAIQIIPEVAKTAAQLTLYQRSPTWVMPREDTGYSETTRKALKNVPMARSFYRVKLMQRTESFHPAISELGSEASEQLRAYCLGWLQTQLAGREDLWKILTPDYAPGCKRILISNDFYPALLQDNVKVETAGIKRVTAKGIETAEGAVNEFDYIILATGFQSRDILQSLPIKGLGGRDLQTIWNEDGIHALYGIGVEDMPNFGMLYGPNTNLAHSSVILMVETQARYIQCIVSEVIKSRRKGGALTVTPKKSRVQEYNDDLQSKLSKTSFADPRCKSWYKTEEGKVLNNWVGTVVQYQELPSTVQWSDFNLTGFGSDALSRKHTKIGRVTEESMLSKTGIMILAGAIAIAAAIGYEYLYMSVSFC